MVETTQRYAGPRQFLRRRAIGPVLVGLTALPLLVVGRQRVVAGMAERWLPRRTGSRSGSATEESSVVARVGAAVVGLFGALLVVYLIWAGELYPVRVPVGSWAHPFAAFPGGEGSWGGPSLFGAWMVHAALALAMQAAAIALVTVALQPWRPGVREESPVAGARTARGRSGGVRGVRARP